MYNEFYNLFRQKLEQSRHRFPENFSVPNHQRDKAYLNYKTGRGRIKFYTEYTTGGYGEGYTGFIVGLYLDGPLYEERLHKLEAHKNKIENNIGESLYWLNTGRAGRFFF